MGERLERLRDDVRARLGSLMSGSTPDDQAVDLALVDGMSSLAAVFPILEAVVEVVTTGYTQDVNPLVPDLMSLLDVTYPYMAGCVNLRREVCQVVGVGIVRFYNLEPIAGETMLVQYRSRYRLAGLQGALQDTLPERYEVGLAQAAVAHLMWLVAMRKRAAGQVDEKAYNLATAAVKDVLAVAEMSVRNVADRLSNPAWGSLGL